MPTDDQQRVADLLRRLHSGRDTFTFEELDEAMKILWPSVVRHDGDDDDA